MSKLIIQGKAWGEFEEAKKIKGDIHISGYRTYGGTHTVRGVELPTETNLENLSDIKELLECALYQPLSSSEIEGNTQAALDLVNKMIGEWSE